MYQFFNSRDAEYRSPFGAVKRNEEIHFKICLPRNMECTGAQLAVNADGGEKLYFDMFWCGMRDDDFEWWECDFTPSNDNIYWYHFQLDTRHNGRKYLSKTNSGCAKIIDYGNPVCWQITAYQEDFNVPQWLSGGLIYQIFPDRFSCSGKKHKGVPDDRKIHENWNDTPDWWPNEHGKITNSDYFGGDLAGITEKLDYIKSLGVTCIYLNPIFEAHENHRYNTANYEKIDPMLGDESDFRMLCNEAHKRGIRIILDGVFSHTGSDSIYFNKNGRYPLNGAYNTFDSPYHSWYKFKNFPNDYAAWWGIKTLPEIIEEDSNYLDYMMGEDGILRRWLRAGADGWRLDVADELPDIFLDRLRQAVKKENPEAVIIGEVWEDATNKIAYSLRRRYLQGEQLDSIMNYPFKDAILGFLVGYPAENMLEIIMNILENYPPQVINILMNHIGTHDTERAITVLAGEQCGSNSRQWQSEHHLSPEDYRRGVQMMKMASLMQYTLPGVPSLYYGDEAGLEGYRDPFNRGCYPWGNEDKELIEWYKFLGEFRHNCPILKDAKFKPYNCASRLFSYIRSSDEGKLFVAINASYDEIQVKLPEEFISGNFVIGDDADENGNLVLQAFSYVVVKI